MLSVNQLDARFAGSSGKWRGGSRYRKPARAGTVEGDRQSRWGAKSRESEVTRWEVTPGRSRYRAPKLPALMAPSCCLG